MYTRVDVLAGGLWLAGLAVLVCLALLRLL